MRESPDIDTKTPALYYAWDHFAYHAQPRQTVVNLMRATDNALACGLKEE